MSLSPPPVAPVIITMLALASPNVPINDKPCPPVQVAQSGHTPSNRELTRVTTSDGGVALDFNASINSESNSGISAMLIRHLAGPFSASRTNLSICADTPLVRGAWACPVCRGDGSEGRSFPWLKQSQHKFSGHPNVSSPPLSSFSHCAHFTVGTSQFTLSYSLFLKTLLLTPTPRFHVPALCEAAEGRFVNTKQSSVLMTKPVASLGWKKVDLRGMRRPASATERT